MSRQRTWRRHSACEGGFSLIELMVVIAIIAMLATVVAVNVLDALGTAEVTKAKADISSLDTALMNYRIVFREFPSTTEGLDALIHNSKDRKFIKAKSIPPDPWGNEYMYTLEDSRNYTIVSYGADGVPGGSDEDADISSDDLAGSGEE